MQETVTESGQRLRVIETALALLLVLLLLAATFRVLLPFAGVLTYAAIIATATSGLFDRMVDLLNGRRRLAAVLFGAVAVTITVVPLIYVSSSVADLVGIAERWLSAASREGIPNLPEWIAGLPLIGKKATAAWQELQREGGVLQQYQPQLIAAGRWLLDRSLGLAGAVIEIFLGVVVAAMIHASRSQILRLASDIAQRVAGPAGSKLLDAAGRAIRGVAIGVIGRCGAVWSSRRDDYGWRYWCRPFGGRAGLARLRYCRRPGCYRAGRRDVLLRRYPARAISGLATGGNMVGLPG